LCRGWNGEMGFILVEELGKESEYGLDLRLVAGKGGLKKRITEVRIDRFGLALAGLTDHVQPHRVYILGNTELSYLKALPPRKREGTIRKICSLKISCFVVTATKSIPKSLIRESEKASIPLFKTGLMSHFFVERATQFLEQKLSAATSVHGVLVDVFGVGVLILGRSGIGKSESALDLITRGHRLVSILSNTIWRFEVWGLSISGAFLEWRRFGRGKRSIWWSIWSNGKRIMIVLAWRSRSTRRVGSSFPWCRSP